MCLCEVLYVFLVIDVGIERDDFHKWGDYGVCILLICLFFLLDLLMCVGSLCCTLDAHIVCQKSALQQVT